MPEKTSGDRRHDITVLVVGFVLTTVLGGTVTAFYSSRQHKKEVDARRVAEAAKFMEELSRGMDTRLSKWRQTATAIERGFPRQSVIRMYSDYAVAYKKWDEGWNWERAAMCDHFGPELTSEYQHAVVNSFIILHDTLTRRLKEHGDYRSQFARESIAFRGSMLAREVFNLNVRLTDALVTGAVPKTGQSCAVSVTEAEAVHLPIVDTAAMPSSVPRDVSPPTIY